MRRRQVVGGPRLYHVPQRRPPGARGMFIRVSRQEVSGSGVFSNQEAKGIRQGDVRLYCTYS